jgi:hypothetical protein
MRFSAPQDIRALQPFIDQMAIRLGVHLAVTTTHGDLVIEVHLTHRGGAIRIATLDMAPVFVPPETAMPRRKGWQKAATVWP